MGRTHSFSIPDGAHWDDVRNVTENVGKAIQKAFRAIEKQIIRNSKESSETVHGQTRIDSRTDC